MLDPLTLFPVATSVRGSRRACRWPPGALLATLAIAACLSPVLADDTIMAPPAAATAAASDATGSPAVTAPETPEWLLTGRSSDFDATAVGPSLALSNPVTIDPNVPPPTTVPDGLAPGWGLDSEAMAAALPFSTGAPSTTLEATADTGVLGAPGIPLLPHFNVGVDITINNIRGMGPGARPARGCPMVVMFTVANTTPKVASGVVSAEMFFDVKTGHPWEYDSPGRCSIGPLQPGESANGALILVPQRWGDAQVVVTYDPTDGSNSGPSTDTWSVRVGISMYMQMGPIHIMHTRAHETDTVYTGMAVAVWNPDKGQYSQVDARSDLLGDSGSVANLINKPEQSFVEYVSQPDHPEQVNFGILIANISCKPQKDLITGNVYDYAVGKQGALNVPTQSSCDGMCLAGRLVYTTGKLGPYSGTWRFESADFPSPWYCGWEPSYSVDCSLDDVHYLQYSVPLSHDVVQPPVTLSPSYARLKLGQGVKFSRWVSPPGAGVAIVLPLTYKIVWTNGNDDKGKINPATGEFWPDGMAKGDVAVIEAENPTYPGYRACAVVTIDPKP